MDLTLSPAEEENHDTLRDWIAENHPGKEPEGDEASFQFPANGSASSMIAAGRD